MQSSQTDQVVGRVVKRPSRVSHWLVLPQANVLSLSGQNPQSFDLTSFTSNNKPSSVSSALNEMLAVVGFNYLS